MAIRNKIDSNETGLAIAEEVIGQPGVLPSVVGGTAATGTITLSGAGDEDDTVMVAGIVFTLKASPAGPLDIDIGANADDTATNIAASVNALVAVNASASTNVVTITAAQTGLAGNAISLGVDGDDLLASGPTLSGGIDQSSGPVWVSMEPNEYDDFGGEPTLLARRPINSSRQRKKGAIVDLAAQGGFNQDFTNDNSQMLTGGFMYANYRNKVNDHPTAVSATGYVVPAEENYAAGMIILATGFTTAANNGLKIVTSVDAGTSEVRAAGLAVEAGPPSDARITLVGVEFAAGVLDVDASGPLPRLTSSASNLNSLGIIPGEMIYVGGDGVGTAFTNAANNGIKRVSAVSAGSLTIDKSDDTMVTEASTSETVQIFLGRVIKNELADLIVRRSYQMERQMGAPDTAQPAQFQAEYVLGAFPNEMELVIESADKINVNYSFVAITNDHRTSVQGLKPGDRVGVIESDAYNTSTDFSRIKLALVSDVNEAPEPLFAFITDMTLNINNNVSLNKAVGYLGGFDATIGLFEVSAEINAYFTKVESQQAIRQNKDVTLDVFVTKENRGFAFDIPLIALGGGLPEVELDEPIMIPLESDAATAVKINPNMDHTLLWVFFDYLPDAAAL